jgi:hypothetical protein
MTIYKWTFEDGASPTFPQSGFIASGNTPIISADRARAGTKSLKAFLDAINSEDTYRTEAVHNDPKMECNLGLATQGYWVAFSMYVPNPYPVLLYPVYELFHQIYMSPPDGVTDYAYNSPPIALYLEPSSSTGGKIKILIRASSAPYPQPFPLPTVYGNTFADYVAGQWTDFVMYYRLDYTTAGLVKAWINGELKLDYAGPNYARGHGGGNRKFGIYSGWRGGLNPEEVTTTRTLYFDEYAFGWDVAYEDVAPGGGGTVINPDPVVREPFGAPPVLPADAVYGVDFDARRQGLAEVSGDGITYNYVGGPIVNEYRPVVDVSPFPKIYTTLGEPGPLYKMGGHGVGYWYEYTASISTTGTYVPKLRCASPTGPTVNPAFRLYANGALIAEFSVPATGSYDTWQTVEAAPVALDAGATVFRVEALATGMGFHRFWIEESAEGPVDPTPPVDPDPPTPGVQWSKQNGRRVLVIGPFGD